MYGYMYIRIYLYITRNMGSQVLRSPTGAIWGDIPGPGGAFSIWAPFLQRKRPGRVLHAMGPNKQVITQQSRASGAVYLSRYDFFCDQ